MPICESQILIIFTSRRVKAHNGIETTNYELRKVYGVALSYTLLRKVYGVALPPVKLCKKFCRNPCSEFALPSGFAVPYGGRPSIPEVLIGGNLRSDFALLQGCLTTRKTLQDSNYELERSELA